MNRHQPAANSYINPELTRGVGVVNPPRGYPNHEPRVRCVGTALAADGSPLLTERGHATVRVLYADGAEIIVPAAAFRSRPPTGSHAPSSTRARTRVAQTGAAVKGQRELRDAIHERLMSQDLPALQGKVD